MRSAQEQASLWRVCLSALGWVAIMFPLASFWYIVDSLLG